MNGKKILSININTNSTASTKECSFFRGLAVSTGSRKPTVFPVDQDRGGVGKKTSVGAATLFL